MTLVVAVTGTKSIWMLTDRRLSFCTRRPKDDASKLLFLETTDGVAMLGYAGLGSTAAGTEPGDWMMRVLRGRKLPLEQSLGVLADAVKAKLPQHLGLLPGLGGAAHNIIIPAFLDREPRLYSIDLVRTRGRSEYSFRFSRNVVVRQSMTGGAPRIAIGGSGAPHLSAHRQWAREVLRMVAAHESGRIGPETVARTFAQVNHHVARADKTVGERCIVAWRFQAGGGAHEYFEGMEKEVNSAHTWIPTIMGGMDVCAIVQAEMPFTMDVLNALMRGETKETDYDSIDAALAKLTDTPDDDLA